MHGYRMASRRYAMVITCRSGSHTFQTPLVYPLDAVTASPSRLTHASRSAMACRHAVLTGPDTCTPSVYGQLSPQPW